MCPKGQRTSIQSPIPVKLGFNSNRRVGDAVYQIQTEDRGPDHPFIDTIVCVQGRVLHRRSTLAIRASGPAGEGEIHYHIKPKPRASEPRAPAP